jgi:hypothetical protein
MKDLLNRLEETTTSASTIALFDGETMVRWPDAQVEYDPTTPRKENDQDLAEKIPDYEMDKKWVELEKEIIDGQIDPPGKSWPSPLPIQDPVLRALVDRLGMYK